MCVFVCLFLYIYLYTYVCVFGYICVCAYVCVFVYIYGFILVFCLNKTFWSLWTPPPPSSSSASSSLSLSLVLFFFRHFFFLFLLIQFPFLIFKITTKDSSKDLDKMFTFLAEDKHDASANAAIVQSVRASERERGVLVIV